MTGPDLPAPLPATPAEPPPAASPWARSLTTFWNGDERRLRAFWRILGQMLLVVLIALAIRALPLPPRGPSGLEAAVLGAVRALATLGSVWLAGRLLDRRRLADFGLQPTRGSVSDLGFGLALGALLMTGVFACEQALGWVEVSGTFVVRSAGDAFGAAFAGASALFLCVGFSEELQFRGYLLRNAAEGMAGRRLGPRAALVVATLLSSALFGLVHSGNPGATVVSTVNVAVAGLLLALPLVLTGRLALSIGLHVTWNLFQGNVWGLPVSGTRGVGGTFVSIQQRGPDLWTGGAFGPEAGLLGLLAMGAGCVLIVAWVRLREGRLELVAALAEPPTPSAGHAARAGAGAAPAAWAGAGEGRENGVA